MNLIVNSVDLICSSNQGIQLLSEILKMMEHIRTDELMQENIIWLVNSMFEQGENVIEVIIEN